MNIILNPIYPQKSHLINYEDFNLSGTPKSIKQTPYSYGKVKHKIEYFTFSKKGNILEKHLYFPKSNLLYRKTIYNYDEGGRILDIIGYDSTGHVLYKEEFGYDENGYNVRYVWLDDGVTEYEKELRDLKYNDAKKVIEIIITKSYKSSNEKSVFSFRYDEKGKVKKRTTYSADMKPIYQTFFNYFKDERIIESTTYKIDSNVIIGRDVANFDKKGNLILREIFTGNDKLFMGEYRKYDDKNNCIEYHCVDIPERRDSKTETSYEYDEKGNWIKEYLGMQMTNKREIEYFE